MLNRRTREERIMAGIYRSTWRTSLLALSATVFSEFFMLGYTLVRPSLFGSRIWEYRVCYLVMILLAAGYIAMSAYARRDIQRRYRLLRIADPVYTTLFYVWTMVITYSGKQPGGYVDTALFMTTALMTMLCFFLTPVQFLVIHLAFDAFMVYMAFTITGSEGMLVNLSFFCIFHFLLGVCFLRMKYQLTERIITEEDRAQMDVMTGLFNRRAYEEDLRTLRLKADRNDLACISIDLNGLKQVNDSAGHEAGDRLIAGATECMRSSLGDIGRLYRVGGDEFIALVFAGQDELQKKLEDFESRMAAWSARNSMELTTSFGCVRANEMPQATLPELVEEADKRMYAAKERYYQATGKQRRRN